MLGVCKPDQISKRELSWIRGKAVVLFVLAGDMWPHTQMSRPSHQADSCWGLSSDWLGPGRSLWECRERHLLQPRDSRAGGANPGPPNPERCPACSPSDTTAGGQTQLWGRAAPGACCKLIRLQIPPADLPWAPGAERMEPAEPC